MDIINPAGMDETCGTCVNGESFDIHDYDDDAEHDTDDDTDDADDGANDDADDATNDGGRGNLCTTKVPSCCCVYFYANGAKITFRWS